MALANPDNSVDQDVAEILRTENKTFLNFKEIVQVHTKKKDILLTRVKEIEYVRDYNNNTGEYINVVFYMPAGQFVYDVYKFRDQLELSIVREYIDKKKKSVERRYKLVLINHNKDMASSHYTKMSREELNTSEDFLVKAQAYLPEDEMLKGIYAEGIYRDATLKNIMAVVLAEIPKDSKFKGKKLKFDVDIVDPINSNTYKNLIVPMGINVMDFPSYLQNTEYGVYNCGLGTFFQRCIIDKKTKDIIFVYPLYDTQRYDKAKKRLDIFYTNSAKFNKVQNTFKVDGDIVKIIAGSDVKSYDQGETDIMNVGDSIISSDPKLILYRNVDVKATSTKADSDKQLKGAQMKKRKDGMVKTYYAPNESNLYKIRSAMIKRTMMTYVIPWHICDIELIYPGMPCKYVYEDNQTKKYKNLKGVVQGVYARFDGARKNTSCLLTICVEKPYLTEEKK